MEVTAAAMDLAPTAPSTTATDGCKVKSKASKKELTPTDRALGTKKRDAPRVTVMAKKAKAVTVMAKKAKAATAVAKKKAELVVVIQANAQILTSQVSAQAIFMIKGRCIC
jgi:hypothetical protein